MDPYWAAIDHELELIKTATTAAEVVAILNEHDPLGKSAGDAFFGGSGGDNPLDDSLTEAGWKFANCWASYHWKMQAPNGDVIEYVEGDVYVLKGDK